MDRQRFITKNYTPPRIAPQRVLTKDDISSRYMVENVYSTMTPEERSQQILGKDLSELDEMISRREEWMCREVIINGKCIMKGMVDDKDANSVEQEVAVCIMSSDVAELFISDEAIQNMFDKNKIKVGDITPTFK